MAKRGAEEAIGVTDKAMTHESDFFESNMTIFIYQIIENTHNKLSLIQFGTQLSYELDKLMSSTNHGSTDRP